MSEFELKNLIAMRIGLDRHNRNCPEPVEAFLVNPIDHGLLGYDSLWGIPVLPDESIRTKRFQIKCCGSAENIEEELAGFTREGATDP